MTFHETMETESQSPSFSNTPSTPSSGMLLRPMIRRLTV